LVQPRIGVRRRLVRVVLPLFATEIDGRIAGIIGRVRRRLALAKTLLTRPPRWLLRDRDAIYGDAFRRRVAGMGMGGGDLKSALSVAESEGLPSCFYA